MVAKTSQQFVAEPGAIMSGARLLSGWTQSGSTWWVGGQTQEFGHSTGVCQSGTACQYPEDVYRDDVLLKRELSLGAVGPGEFYFDYAADRIYVGDDPNGHKLEAAATEYAFMGSPDGSGTGVVDRRPHGREVRQRGAVRSHRAERTPSAGGSFATARSAGTTARRSAPDRSRSGLAGSTTTAEAGIVGRRGCGTLIRDNEIDHNNTVGFLRVVGSLRNQIRRRDHQPASKSSITTSTTTTAIGLWADGFNDQFVWDSNTVVNNTWDGIKVEISYGGKVRWNTVTGERVRQPATAAKATASWSTASGGSGLEIAYNTLSREQARHHAVRR